MGLIEVKNTGTVRIASDMSVTPNTSISTYGIDWVASFYQNQILINQLKNKRYTSGPNQGHLVYEVEFDNNLNQSFFKILNSLDGGNPANYRFNQFHYEDIDKISAFIAYIIATFKLETGGIRSNNLYSPVREAYYLGVGSQSWLKYLRSKAGIYRGPVYPTNHPYSGVPIFYGRGLTELTHQDNYDKLNDVLKAKIPNFSFDLLTDPDSVLEFDISMAVSVEGMLDGLFTGLSLKKVWKKFSNDTQTFFYECRPIINSYDQAELIAFYAMDFYKVMVVKEL